MHFRHLDAFFAELADNITRLRDGKPSTTSTGALAGAPEAEAILEKFRAMADSLARSREEITRINAGLEARVKERTAESRRKSAGLSAVFLSMTEGFLLFFSDPRRSLYQQPLSGFSFVAPSRFCSS